MTLHDDLSSVTWLDPWAQLTADEAPAHERVLQSSLSEAHPLYGRQARALAARHDDAGDVLFVVNAPDELCVVNLSGAAKRSATSPYFASFASADEFVHGCMLPDHLEHTDDDV
jgi:hypothetical protein